MEQSPSWVANMSSDNLQNPRTSWNPKVHYRIHKCPPPVPILSQINTGHATHPISWRSILTLSFHLRLGFPSGLFPSSFPTKTLYTPLLYPIRVTCPDHLIPLDLITRICGEECRPLSSSLCSFLYSPVTSSLLDPNTLLNTLFSNTLSLRSSLNASDQVSHPYKSNRQNYSYIYLNLYILAQQTGRLRIPDRMMASIPCHQSALSSRMQFLFRSSQIP